MEAYINNIREKSLKLTSNYYSQTDSETLYKFVYNLYSDIFGNTLNEYIDIMLKNNTNNISFVTDVLIWAPRVSGKIIEDFNMSKFRSINLGTLRIYLGTLSIYNSTSIHIELNICEKECMPQFTAQFLENLKNGINCYDS